MNINKVIIVGRIGSDPELKHLQSGSAVCNLSVATTKSWKKDGQKQEKTEWHRIVTFNKTAENCSKYLVKGQLVLVEGELSTRKWEDQNGSTRYMTEIQAFNVQFGSKAVSNSDKASISDVSGVPNHAPKIDEGSELPF